MGRPRLADVLEQELGRPRQNTSVPPMSSTDISMTRASEWASGRNMKNTIGTPRARRSSRSS